MKHPGDELYADLKPAFAARGVAGFADQLQKLASLVEKEAPISAVKSAYSELESAIEAAAKGAASPDVKTRLEVAEHLVRTAAEEYAVGVKDGKVVNAHEYQDALGFVRIAKKTVTAADADSKADAEALERAKAQFEGIESAWPGVVAPKTVDADASLIYGAADWIEIAAMKAR
ncbi:MAG: hypothetical protein COW30_07635 [Rhodospirillales bacterium CG15_BIG_FIL_POST_REV_8_21_14_020_66_15]|nr:MAG: hypothetical protein COW30_07635 [Rhodospirillales bacterium CG15_BIG_FIL_POST_REV_8_21_14_020_66_15]